MNILIGVCGGISVYKSCELVRLLQKNGCNVIVVMTECAQKFITKTTFETLSKNKVLTDIFLDPLQHIELARWTDRIIIAPATATTLSRLRYGMANDLLSAICLATEAKIFLAPAMNEKMWQNQILQENLFGLKKYGYEVILPIYGDQACGDIGYGRMANVDTITKKVLDLSGQLSGKRVLITLGSTVEKIDPVRYLSNFSSGKMGVEIAKACQVEGASLSLVVGKIEVKLPDSCEIWQVKNSDEMISAVNLLVDNNDIIISVAAICDYKPLFYSSEKIKKDAKKITLELVPTEDLLCSLKEKTIYKIGFCAETNNLVENARKKISSKGIDCIIANKIHANGNPFGSDYNKAIFITKNYQHCFNEMSKSALAVEIVKKIAEFYDAL